MAAGGDGESGLLCPGTFPGGRKTSAATKSVVVGGGVSFCYGLSCWDRSNPGAGTTAA